MVVWEAAVATSVVGATGVAVVTTRLPLPEMSAGWLAAV